MSSSLSVEKEYHKETTVLFLSGKLDYNTSPDFEETLMSAFRSANRVVVDLYKLHYMSSAGMRVLLAGQRKANSEDKSFMIVNAGENVMELMEMMGFTRILQIERAKRERPGATGEE